MGLSTESLIITDNINVFEAMGIGKVLLNSVFEREIELLSGSRTSLTLENRA